MTDLHLNDVGKARLFRNAQTRERAGLPPIFDVESDPRAAPALQGPELRAFWARVWERAQNTLEGSVQERHLAAWRICRYLAVVRGLIQHYEPLEQIQKQKLCLDNTEFTSFVEIRDGELRERLAGGLPVVPPDVPATMLLSDGSVNDSYLPAQDALLLRYVDAIAYVGNKLELWESDKARRGFEWFVDPDTIRAGWPRMNNLYRFEVQLINDAVAIVMDNADDDSRTEIAARWDLTQPEVEQVFALVRRALALQQRLEDRDGNKALVLAKINKLSQKAQEAYDYRGAGMLQREWWRVFDSRADQDLAEDFEHMTQTLASSAEKRRALPKPQDS